MKKIVTGLCLTILLTSCAMVDANRNYNEVSRSADSDKITVGVVQREIREGMSSADVIGVLGSPNLVSTDDQRREVWVYDKISTENVYSSNSGNGNRFLSLNSSKNTGASRTSQKTLTIIVKFDKNSKVRDFSYRTTSF